MAEVTHELTFTLTPSQALYVLEAAQFTYDSNKFTLIQPGALTNDEREDMEATQLGLDDLLTTLREQFRVALDENRVDLATIRPDWYK